MRNFDSVYLNIAEIWAQNSYARRSKVGAIIVKDNRIISDGYNGTPNGFDNTCEEYHCHLSHDTSAECPVSPGITISDKLKTNTHNCYACSGCSYSEMITKKEVLHAEANAITKLCQSAQSSEGATIYVTMSPCFECAKLIIQAGIKRVVYREEYRETSGIKLLKDTGIEVVHLPN